MSVATPQDPPEPPSFAHFGTSPHGRLRLGIDKCDTTNRESVLACLAVALEKYPLPAAPAPTPAKQSGAAAAPTRRAQSSTAAAKGRRQRCPCLRRSCRDRATPTRRFWSPAPRSPAAAKGRQVPRGATQTKPRPSPRPLPTPTPRLNPRAAKCRPRPPPPECTFRVRQAVAEEAPQAGIDPCFLAPRGQYLSICLTEFAQPYIFLHRIEVL